MNIKKSIMTTLWRVQQAQMFISIIFWSLTLSGIFYPYISARFLNEIVGNENVFIGMSLIFLTVIILVISFGYAYDKLKIWKEQMTVAQERNPYTYGSKVTPIQALLFYAVLNPDNERAQHLASKLLDSQMSDPNFKSALRNIIIEVD